PSQTQSCRSRGEFDIDEALRLLPPAAQTKGAVAKGKIGEAPAGRIEPSGRSLSGIRTTAVAPGIFRAAAPLNAAKPELETLKEWRRRAQLTFASVYNPGL